MADIVTAKCFPPVALLSDEKALSWLVEKGKIDQVSAQKIVSGCRAALTTTCSGPADNQHVHALDSSAGRVRLLSRVGYPFALSPRGGDVQVPLVHIFVQRFDFPQNFLVAPGDYGDVGSFAYALFAAYATDPFGGFTIATSSVCCADEQIILDWCKDVVKIRHKNFLAMGYGAVPKFGAFLLGVTEEVV